jgi:hypothetical protein
LAEDAAAPVAPAEASPDKAEVTETVPQSPPVPTRPPEYWLRVHGYPPVPLHSFPFDLNKEVVYYNDFFDPRVGRLAGDPRLHLHEGDVLIYYADGGAVVYAIATVAGEVEGPLPDSRRGQKWLVPIKREALIRTVNKAPHAVALEPPSGWHFLRAVRDYTYIRLPDEDGPYLVEQVRSRASARE